MATVCGKEVTLPNPKDNVAVAVYVRDKLLAQGKKSGKGGGCVFRGDGNCACALGWLLPDDDYRDLGEYFPDVQDEILMQGYDYSLLKALQLVHDKYLVAQWERLLNLIIFLLKAKTNTSDLERLIHQESARLCQLSSVEKK